MTADGLVAISHTTAGGESESIVSDEMSRTPSYRGHDVVDPTHRLIGTISDVVYDDGGEPQWAVVDLGLLRSSHYIPVGAGYMSQNGEFVVPYDKKVVKSGPKADRSHVIDAGMSRELQRHYELT